MPPQPRHVDPRIWRACAGVSVRIPSLHSRVYYFPQGHLEQCHHNNNFSSLPLFSSAMISCHVSSVQLLSDPLTDEVFAKLLLDPSPASSPPLPVFDDQEKLVAFAKILTPSDANNGGGFSVPRFCADSIFPPLDFNSEPPVQTLTFRDISGISWDFRHIYRGTPRRHLLTTGWSRFVNNKKLIAGDSVVFMRSKKGEMFIGVRRQVRRNGGDCARWRDQARGREAVFEAVESAVKGMPFEVVYYPRAGWYSDFVVKAEVVEASLSGFWSPGMRVKMGVETEDSSRMSWFQGTVVNSSVPDSSSPWRMLQVTWDEPEILQSARRVNPWQVEFLSPTPQLHAAFPPAKRSRFPRNSTDGEGDMYFPMSGLTNSTMGHINSSLLNCQNFPAGMQGARQDAFSILGLSNLVSENAPQMCTNIVSGNNSVSKLGSSSSEINIGSPQSENLSPDSQIVIHSLGNSSKVGIGSFQLFGKIIHMNPPVEACSGVSCAEDGNTESDGTDGALELSLTSSYTELLSTIDVECRRASAVEACSL